jgi:hypothetical protein
MPVMPRRQVAEATISKDRLFGSGKSSKKQKLAAMGDNPATNYSHNRPNHSKPITNLDLRVVDEAFGKYSDLYEDVLRVGTTATQEDIQLAYFDRRSELFTLLAKIDAKPQSESMVNQRYKAERKMDSVVLAVRILGDPNLRVAYDRIRSRRLQIGTTPSKSYKEAAPRLVTPTAAAAGEEGNPASYDTRVMEDSGHVGMEDRAAMSPPRDKREERRKKESPKRSRNLFSSPGKNDRKRGSSKNRPLNATPPESTESLDAMMDDDDGDDDDVVPVDKTGTVEETSTAMESRQEDDTLAGTLETASTHDVESGEKGSGMFSCLAGSRIFRKISDEISGACEDTLVSVDQVFNAFTLTDKDIKAVTKKIHKAKRQLDT